MAATPCFKAAWWLKNAHSQTIYARFAGRRRTVKVRQERFELPDGDFLDCTWSGDAGPIVLILHGLEGSADSHYAKGMLQAAAENGWRGVVMHFRSCGQEMNRLARGYHSGDTADLAYYIASLQVREPTTPIVAVGYSMGGNVLLKWLGETGSSNPLQAAVAVCVPFELHKAAENLTKGITRLYQNYFLGPLKAKVLQKITSHQLAWHPQQIRAIRSVKEYDHIITAPMHGFASGMDYYLSSSSRYYLSGISVPTLVIHAKDDPFMTDDILPEPHELTDAVQLEVHERGGHVGFVAGGNPFKPIYWLEQRVPAFFSNFLNATK